LVSLLLAGCAGSSSMMRDVPADQSDYAPEPGQALVVFMRPSGLGFAIQSVVFDATPEEPKLVGIVSAKTKIAYQVDPGEHRFMVVSESADFMDATLSEGKTYYALVTPRIGVWRARFSLHPVRKNEIGEKEFNEWIKDTRWVENTEQSDAWARDNMPSVREKQAENITEWLNKPDKPILYPQDGS
jgi:hypothetical protein